MQAPLPHGWQVLPTIRSPQTLCLAAQSSSSLPYLKSTLIAGKGVSREEDRREGSVPQLAPPRILARLRVVPPAAFGPELVQLVEHCYGAWQVHLTPLA